MVRETHPTFSFGRRYKILTKPKGDPPGRPYLLKGLGVGVWGFLFFCKGERALTKRPFAPSPKFLSLYALKRRRRKELVTTETELMAMAAAARAGLRVQPQMG